MMWRVVALWVAALSLLEFCLMGLDKHRAKTNAWRVRESTFFLVGLLGGALGGVLGMYTFRHKTRHWYFKYGLPAILILQLWVIWWAVGRGLL